jgi:hypothetical protein
MNDVSDTISIGELRTMLSFAMHRDMVDVYEVLNVVETNLDLHDGAITDLANDIEGGRAKLKSITEALYRAQMKAVRDVLDFINDDEAALKLRASPTI